MAEDAPLSPQKDAVTSHDEIIDAKSLESMLNMCLLDPPRWGWSAIGGVADLLHPHECARRKKTKDFAVRSSCQATSNQKKKATGRRTPTPPLPKSPPEQQEPGSRKSSSTGIGDCDAIQTAGDTPAGPQHASSTTPVANSLLSFPESTMQKTPVTNITQVAVGSLLDFSQCSGSTPIQGQTAPVTPAESVPNEQQKQQQQQQHQQVPVTAKPPSASVSETTPKVTSSLPASGNPLISTNSQEVASAGKKIGPVRQESFDCKQDKPKAVITGEQIEALSKCYTVVGGKALKSKANQKERKKRWQVSVSALGDKDGDALDIYTYHRGREGQEIRDDHTGKLLCDVPRADTGYSVRAPDMIAKVIVTFPLGELGDNLNGDAGAENGDPPPTPNEKTTESTSSVAETSGRNNRKKSLPDNGSTKEPSNMVEYREVVEFDLSNPRTLTPLAFAQNIATEYGLSFGQTLDLAAGVQKQIDEHVADNCKFKPPMTLKDPYGFDRLESFIETCVTTNNTHMYGAYTPRRTAKHKESNHHHLSTKKSSLVASSFCSDRKSHSSTKRSDPTKRARVMVSTYDVDPKYRDEVIRRAKADFQVEICKMRSDETIEETGFGTIVQNHNCHICRNRKPFCLIFSCCNRSHAYCTYHMETRLGMTLDEQAAKSLDFCPICCRTCICAKCAPIMEGIARQLKSECDSQGKEPNEVVFENALERCRGIRKQQPKVTKSVSCSDSNHVSPRARGHKSKAAKKLSPGRQVPKISRTCFPFEVFGGVDLDPGTAKDYRTVFTADGEFLLPEGINAIEAEKESTDKREDDGNESECCICRQTGSLICCDTCPRSWHLRCCPSRERPDTFSSRWSCFSCTREKQVQPEDKLEVNETNVTAISHKFSFCKYMSNYTSIMEILALIYQMLERLINYDFGVWFAEPVPDSVDGYYDKIRRPMDLGTIKNNLTSKNGYVDKYRSDRRENKSMDDIVLAVFEDIEQVWHNCFVYNEYDSMIYRAGELQQAKYQKMLACSLNDRLSDYVKKRVKLFKEKCMCERTVGSSEAPSEKKRPATWRHKFINNPDRSKGRFVVVLDPESSTIVKIYSSIKGAVLAATFLADLGMEAEFPTKEATVRELLKQSAQDPSLLLFGYRWFHYDELKRSMVKLPKKEVIGRQHLLKISSSTSNEGNTTLLPPGVLVEKKSESSRSVFASIEDAFRDTVQNSNGISLELFAKKLVECEIGTTLTMFNCEWKLFSKDGGPQQSNEKQNTDTNKNGSFSDGIFRADGCESVWNVTIVKQDSTTGMVLGAFKSLASAFEDWKETCDVLRVRRYDGNKNLKLFQDEFLNGSSKIEGIVWKEEPVFRNVSNESEKDHENTSQTDDSARSLEPTVLAGSNPECNAPEDSKAVRDVLLARNTPESSTRGDSETVNGVSQHCSGVNLIEEEKTDLCQDSNLRQEVPDQQTVDVEAANMVPVDEEGDSGSPEGIGAAPYELGAISGQKRRRDKELDVSNFMSGVKVIKKNPSVEERASTSYRESDAIGV